MHRTCVLEQHTHTTKEDNAKIVERPANPQHLIDSISVNIQFY